MKLFTIILAFICLFTIQIVNADMFSFMSADTTENKTLFFRVIHTLILIGTEYIHWNFGDGTTDTVNCTPYISDTLIYR
jgi:hypothetical protein